VKVRARKQTIRETTHRQKENRQPIPKVTPINETARTAVKGDELINISTPNTTINTVEPLITDTAGEFKFCPLVGVRQVTYEGDSGNRIFVLYWRCSLISVSVIRGSTVASHQE
jgi:hypothetical protein